MLRASCFILLLNLTFHFITLFPEAIEPYLKGSIVGRARAKNLVKVKYYNPLNFTSSKHGKVDDRPYGGGPGMVMQIEPILKAIQAGRISAKGGSASGGNRQKVKIILFSAGGKQLKSVSMSRMVKGYKHFILICGRYEGIDERVKRILKDELSAKGGSASGGQIEELSVGP